MRRGNSSEGEEKRRESADADRESAAAGRQDFSDEGHAAYLRREVAALPKTLRESAPFAAYWPTWLTHLIETNRKRPSSVATREHAAICLEVFRASGPAAAVDCLRFAACRQKTFPIVDSRTESGKTARQDFPTRPVRDEPAPAVSADHLAENFGDAASAYAPSGDGPPVFAVSPRRKPDPLPDIPFAPSGPEMTPPDSGETPFAGETDPVH